VIQVTGPWVLVVGMHRSGTSAVTGALGALGLELVRTDDRVFWPESNPEHWESLSLGLHNEDILARFGGGWDGPPDLEEGWERRLEIADAADPTDLLVAAFPDPGPKVFKDPRLCLLLPYWRNLLPDPIAAVLVWRSPIAVARSLERRDGTPLPEGLALWERYNREAVGGLAGIDTYVVDYESVVTDPGATIDGLVNWLTSLEQFVTAAERWDRAAASTVIADELAHHRSDPSADDDAVVLAAQRDLAGYLSKIGGGHRPFSPEPLGNESAWTSSVIQLRRELVAPRKELEATKEQLEDTREWLANLRASTSWRITRPLRTLTTSLDELRHDRAAGGNDRADRDR
jgi:hypothetical protein